METEHLESIHINAIRQEFLRIENDWLMLHFKLSIALAVLALAAECVLGALVVQSDILSTTVERYILKFIAAPSAVSFLLVAVGALFVRSRRVEQSVKVYAVSILYTLICFDLFTAHSAFVSMYFLFGIAILLTTIYANYVLTGVITLLSFSSMIVSELFIRWDVDKVSVFQSSERLFDFLIALVVLLGCGAVCAVIIHYEKKKNEAGIQKELERATLKHRLQIDELTGVFSRKALHDALRDLTTGITPYGYVFAIADIDNFKDVNDRCGHHIGDLCLIAFTRVLQARFGEDSVYRYGGDEFCVLMHGVSRADFLALCELAQADLTELSIEEAPELRFTASFGTALYDPDLDNAARLFIHADQALYEAKRTRNAIRVFQRGTEPLSTV
ncbi:MAG TPA: GGDEF domain-containing protein [Feifaniaceae bacterium]|nr:GGDEF domain-containing protein [Feifaniaceae bacterium]